MTAKAIEKQNESAKVMDKPPSEAWTIIEGAQFNHGQTRFGVWSNLTPVLSLYHFYSLFVKNDISSNVNWLELQQQTSL